MCSKIPNHKKTKSIYRPSMNFHILRTIDLLSAIIKKHFHGQEHFRKARTSANKFTENVLLRDGGA